MPIIHNATVIRDHLGNTRVTFSDQNGDGQIDPRASSAEIHQENHYYPFGLTMQKPSYSTTASPEHRYQYNGKERDPLTDWIDYGARWYDPAIARWGQVDPLAEAYHSMTPYNYVTNNPMNTIDPDGRWAQQLVEGGSSSSSDGSINPMGESGSSDDSGYENGVWVGHERPPKSDGSGNDKRYWTPQVSDDGSISYVSQENASYSTFVEQFGEEAANEIFNSNCDQCYDKEAEYGEGEMVLYSEKVYSLIVKMAAKCRKYTATDLTSIINQLDFAKEYEESQNSNSFDMNDYFRRKNGDNVHNIRAQGEYQGHTVYLQYSNLMDGSNILSTSWEKRPGGGIVNYKREYRRKTNNGSHAYVPLFITFKYK